jgi:hypothetical protein
MRLLSLPYFSRTEAQLLRNRPAVFAAHAAQSKGGGQAVQTGSSGCANSSNQSGSGGDVDCSCYASQASRR